jgi:hypothetical protein
MQKDIRTAATAEKAAEFLRNSSNVLDVDLNAEFKDALRKRRQFKNW